MCAQGYDSVAPESAQAAPHGVPTQVQYQQPPAQVAPAPPSNAGVAPAPSSGADNGSARQVSDRQQDVSPQQQRLLLLRHAAICQHDDDHCPVNRHCAGMKRLWEHMVECKDQKCLVSHCVSSRYVLGHFRRCKDDRCPVCRPVRAEKRRHEKQKQMQALKRRHQLAVQQNQMSGPNGV